MTITTTQFGKDIHKLLDQVLESGEPLQIEHKGHRLNIIPEASLSRLQRLKSHHTVNGNPDDLVNDNWKEIWKPHI